MDAPSLNADLLMPSIAEIAMRIAEQNRALTRIESDVEALLAKFGQLLNSDENRTREGTRGETKDKQLHGQV